jgi:hypothetical protein
MPDYNKWTPDLERDLMLALWQTVRNRYKIEDKEWESMESFMNARGHNVTVEGIRYV